MDGKNKCAVAAVILAAGKGTRLNSKTINKVAMPFLGRPMIQYAVEVLQGIAAPILIVIGAFSDSVKKAVNNYHVLYIHQKKRLGTGHAVKVCLPTLCDINPLHVLVGYADHMMFYKKTTLKKFIDNHIKSKAVVSLISTKYHDPNWLAWGHIERDNKGNVLDIVEHKDANEKQRKIKEINAGFYCFNFDFIKQNIKKLKKTNITGEYYITDLVKIAVSQKLKTIGYIVRFREVGIGINKHEELAESQRIYRDFHGV